MNKEEFCMNATKDFAASLKFCAHELEHPCDVLLSSLNISSEDIARIISTYTEEINQKMGSKAGTLIFSFLTIMAVSDKIEILRKACGENLFTEMSQKVKKEYEAGKK